MLEAQALDVQKLRGDFPILQRKVRGKRLVYLDSAATSQKPKTVIDTISDYYSRYNSNVHRSVHTLGEEATAAYEAARVKTAKFVGASTKDLIFVRGTTEATNLVRFAWGDKFVKSGDTLVTTLMEHHSNIVPWQLLARSKGASLKFVGLNPDGTLDMASFEALLKESPSLVAVAHASNVLGTINDVSKICSMARGAGAVTVVDGAQSVPHMPVDFNAVGCDFYAFSVTGDTPVLIDSEDEVRLVPIEEAVKLHRRGKSLSVLTLGPDAKARFERVQGTLCHLEGVYEVRYENSAVPVRATGHHSVYVWREGDIVEEKVCNLRKGDYLVTLNKQSQARLGNLATFPVVFTHHGNLIRETVEINRELMRLIGYYLAEGSIDPQGSRISLVFGEHEGEFVRDACAIIEGLEPIRHYLEAFERVKMMQGSSLVQIALTSGISRKTAKKYSALAQTVDSVQVKRTACRVWYNQDNHTANVAFNSKKWFEFFKSTCGTKDSKHLPSFAWRIRPELVAELLKGYLRGDGCKTEEYRLKVKSVSKRLIGELSWLLKLQGISNTLGYARSNVPTWNDQYWLVIQRSELKQIAEFHRLRSKHDAPRDKSLCVDALKAVYRHAKPRYNSRVSSTLRSAHKRATKDGVLNVIRWIESTHRLPIGSQERNILERYKQLVEGDFGLVQVRRVTPVGEHTVYDISVDGTERFFGGFYPILLHNSGHKMLGPTGIGALIGRKPLLEEMEPFHGGGEMIKEVFLDHSTWNEVPYKFEAGTVNIADAIGLGAAVDYLTSLGMERVRDHEVRLLRYAAEVLAEVKGFRSYGPADPNTKAGVIAFNLADVHPHDLATILDEEGIAIRSGHHCAQPLMRWLDVSATSRASFQVYNSFDDIDALKAGLQKAGAIFGI